MKNSFPKTIILRHRKENLRKCSLSGLEQNENLLFYTYPKDNIQPSKSYFYLSFDGIELSKKDREKGIFLIDATWHYAAIMTKKHTSHLKSRSLPRGIKTAYPRRQDDCIDPSRGLASIEALYVAKLILGRNVTNLLDNYYFKDKFLDMNKDLLSTLA